jgi:hypothetical protein
LQKELLPLLLLMNNIKILQININKNATTTENVLQIAIELDIKILVVQEPWVIESNREYRSINHPNFK